MQKFHKSALTALSLAIVGAGVFGISHAYAAGGGYNKPSLDGLAQALAVKFNLDVNEVNSFLSEEHEKKMLEKAENHQAKILERIQSAVESGEISANQAEMLEDKMEEMESFALSLSESSPDERREAMNAKRSEIRSWLLENDIPVKFFMNHHKMRHGLNR